MHSDSKKRRSSFLVALLFTAGDLRCYADGSRTMNRKPATHLLLLLIGALALCACRDEKVAHDSAAQASSARGDSPTGVGTDAAYYGFFPSARGSAFKLFRHNILGFEIDIPASWVFGVVGAHPNAVALLYPEGLNTAKLGPDWKTIELGEIPFPGVSPQDAMELVLNGMRSKHASLRVVSEPAATKIGGRSSVTSTITWTSKAGFVVTEKLYVVEFGKALRSVAVRSANPDPARDLTDGDGVIQTFVPLQPAYK